ncbi:MAG: FecR domain-containing protein [Clostridia bacterium]|nr:FecR domain-containing protein [Clostridia bacterium]MBQ7542761.1 FecR domain-containing protein [Clostridia bacterium]
MNALKHFPCRARSVVKLLRTLALVLVVVFALQLLPCSAHADGGREITLLELSGSCRVERGGDALEAAEGMALFSGDTLVTDEGGSLRLRIDGDKFLYLGADTRVRIIAEGTAESSKTVVFVESGSVMTEVTQKLSEESSFDVVTSNTTMSIRGTKTLTEVIEDVVSDAVQTSNAVLEGHVRIKAVKVKADGTVVSVEKGLGAGEGNAFKSLKEELVSPEEMMAIAGTDASVSGIKVEIVSEEEAGVVFDMATFSATFLENIKNILIAEAEDAAEEEGLSQEQIDEINTLIDEAMNSLDVIRENSQNAINAAADTGKKPEPAPEPLPQLLPMPVPDPVPVTESDNTQDEGTTLVDGDTNLIDIGDDNADEEGDDEGDEGDDADAGEENDDNGDEGDQGGEGGQCGEDEHEWGDPVVVDPYADTDDEGLVVWHAGTSTKTCGVCKATEEEPILVTPVLKSEIYEDTTKLPIDFFWAEGKEAPEEGMMLKDHALPQWWVSSPLYNDDPETAVDIPFADVSWKDGDILLSTLSVNDTLAVQITIPENFRDTFKDTDVEITLTEPIDMSELS